MADQLQLFYDSVLDPLTEGVGLAGSPAKRFTVVTLLSGVIIYLWKPSAMFLADGSIRPWTVTSPNANGATNIPVYVLCPIIGAAAALFL